MPDKALDDIKNAKTVLGIEFGSTRIKAVLADFSGKPLSSGSFLWENKLENGFWTYSRDEIIFGLKECFKSLSENVEKSYGVKLKNIGAIGISGMMHGYIALDENFNMLVPFRTWRNANTVRASKDLTDTFGFNIPNRWSVAHLYEAILNNEPHLKNIKYVSTLAVYIHYLLTGEFAAGVGEASGMFPIDDNTVFYDENMLAAFDKLASQKGFTHKISDMLPRVLKAGESAGALTDDGAKLLDSSGALKSGIRFCPPEGDAGTGMAATNSASPKTGNISAGTSVFLMVVLEHKLKEIHPEIDVVSTPDGKPVAMVHCNNCSGDIDAWVNLFAEFSSLSGNSVSKDKLYDLLFNEALKGNADCGGLVSYNFISGEQVVGLSDGVPMFIRDGALNLADFMRTHLYSALAALHNGMKILETENVEVESLSGHGGYFKTAGAGQKIAAAALNADITVMRSAGEGGPWGMALLALYMLNHKENETLESFLENKIFNLCEKTTVSPCSEDVKGFLKFMKKYNSLLSVENSAAQIIKNN